MHEKDPTQNPEPLPWVGMTSNPSNLGAGGLDLPVEVPGQAGTQEGKRPFRVTESQRAISEDELKVREDA